MGCRPQRILGVVGLLISLGACVPGKAGNGDTSTHGADLDGDGWWPDCDELDPEVHPGATEWCNSLDDDCDGRVDEEAADATPYYADLDGDGRGAGEALGTACESPAGTSSVGDDCDDADPTVSPAAPEVCDGVDDDCDGEVDEDAVDGTVAWPDADGDGAGDSAVSAILCELVEGWVSLGGDCDDTDRNRSPTTSERCNRIDDDCDGEVDEDGETRCDLWASPDLGDSEIRMLGEIGSRFGRSVIFAGDLDGDGADEVAVGADNDGLAVPGSGAVYIFAGAPAESGAASDGAIATLEGCSEGGETGSELSRAGDVDGDGFADLWVVSRYDTCEVNEGRVDLFLGPVVSSGAITEADASWLGERGRLGIPVVSGHGDYDADGVPDLALGSWGADGEGLAPSSGEAWIVRGGVAWGESWLDAAGIALVRDVAEDRFGAEVSLVGDSCGDGTDDLVVTGFGDESNAGAGWIWVVEDSLADGTYQIDDVAAARVEGAVAGDTLGWDMSGLGDVDGDGAADFAVGAEMESTLAFGGGAVYVFLGPVGARTSVAEADLTLLGGSTYEKAVVSGGRGDLDADGALDLVVGAYEQGEHGESPGRVFLLRGPLEMGVFALNDAAESTLVGEDAYDWAGFSVDIHGDANGDGFADLLVGAPLHGEAWSGGVSYLVFGQPTR